MGASKTATVVYGPPVWQGRSGVVVEEREGEVVVVRFEADEGCRYPLEVQFPKPCLEIEDVRVEA